MKILRAFAPLTVAVALLSGCATIDTSNLSPSCRGQYDACLSSCQSPYQPPQRMTPDSNLSQVDTQTPSCVDSCNRKAKSCT